MSGEIFANKYRVVPGKAAPESQITAGNYPASSSYIDVSGCERVHLLIHLGAVHASDAPTFEIKQASAANGTLKAVSEANLKWTGTGSSDNQLVMMTVEVDKLDIMNGYKYLTVVAAGTLSNGTYADIVWLLPMTSEPVTQNSTICPAANQLVYVG